MNAPFDQPAGIVKRGPPRGIILQALLVGVSGLIFGFSANRLSPCGLTLSRDYFHESGSTSPGHSLGTLPSREGSHSLLSGASEAGITHLREGEIRRIDRAEAERWFRDPRYSQQQIVFIDARDDSHYQESHVPGSYQFDYYRAEHFLPTVIPICQGAENIVVYCDGENCEDSRLSALTLREAGIPAERLHVLVGGMTEWQLYGLPCEVGQRNSGKFQTMKR